MRKLPPIPQVFDGFKRDCDIKCESCGKKQVFTVYADKERSDEWCNAELDEMLKDDGWLVGDGDEYCPDCMGEV